MPLPILVDAFTEQFSLCGGGRGSIETLLFDGRRKSSVRSANAPIVPVADKVTPY
jgi:hypothetical protein